MESQNQEESTEKTTTQGSNWLKDLGEQSWQAELVISGLVITGLFQMPDVFLNWVESSIIQSGEMEYSFLNMASLIFLLGIDVLIIYFGVHLLFRGIWIALLGLNSVFPAGVDINSKNGMGEKYWQKAKEKYPNLTEYCTKLDADCSLLFSSATLIIIIVSSISIIILVFYQLIRFLVSVFPIIAQYALYIGLGAYLTFLIIALFMVYIGKKYPDSKRVEKVLDGYSKVMETVYSLYFFRKPVGYIVAIQNSNIKPKWLIFMLASCTMGFVGGRQTAGRSVFSNFEADKYFTFNNKPHQILAFNYENLINKDAEIYTPIIQSDVISDDYIKVFIPTIAREAEQMKFKEYGIVERFKMKDAQREARDKERLEAYKQFNRIKINDVAYPNLEYQFYAHPQASDRGLLVYIPTDSLAKGRNILEIRKNYFSKDSVQKIVKIPFFFKRD